jgi:hypothetical protein
MARTIIGSVFSFAIIIQSPKCAQFIPTAALTRTAAEQRSIARVQVAHCLAIAVPQPALRAARHAPC